MGFDNAQDFRGPVVESPQELALLLASSVQCYAHWNQSGCSFKTSSGRVKACRGALVQIEHWETRWYNFNDPVFTICQSYYEGDISRFTNCRDKKNDNKRTDSSGPAESV